MAVAHPLLPVVVVAVSEEVLLLPFLPCPARMHLRPLQPVFGSWDRVYLRRKSTVATTVSTVTHQPSAVAAVVVAVVEWVIVQPAAAVADSVEGLRLGEPYPHQTRRRQRLPVSRTHYGRWGYGSYCIPDSRGRTCQRRPLH